MEVGASVEAIMEREISVALMEETAVEETAVVAENNPTSYSSNPALSPPS